jgi:hypothetical protein
MLCHQSAFGNILTAKSYRSAGATVPLIERGLVTPRAELLPVRSSENHVFINRSIFEI